MAQLDAQAANKIIEEEAARCRAALIAEQSRLGIRAVSGNLSKIKVKVMGKDASGIYRRVRFTFPRYGVFVAKGAGRGYGGEKGSSWKNVRGITIHTNPASLGKMNSGSRKAKDWFNPVIENFVQVLNEKLSDFFVQACYQRLKIK